MEFYNLLRCARRTSAARYAPRTPRRLNRTTYDIRLIRRGKIDDLRVCVRQRPAPGGALSDGLAPV